LWALSQNLERRLLASSVCPSICPHGPHLTEFHEIRYLSTFRKSVEKIKDSLKRDKNNVTVREDQFTFMIVCRSVLLRVKNVSDKIRKQSKNSNFSLFFF